MKHRKEYPSAGSYRDVRGRLRWRYRKNGFTIQLGTEYGSTEFVQRYHNAVLQGNKSRQIGVERTVQGTVNHLVSLYYKTVDYKSLAQSTQSTYRGIIERFRTEHGHKRVAGLKPRHIEELMADRFDTPNAANNMRKRLAQLMDLAVKLEWLPTNPVRQTKPLKTALGGHHTWTETEISKFFAVHPLGTTAHTAVTLMLYTGAARVDVVKLGWFSVKSTGNEHRLEYRRQKTLKSNGQLVSIPLHPDLRTAMSIWDRNTGTFLNTNANDQRAAAGLGNVMRKWCDAADLPNCTAHGLRKACARRLAEAGATAPEIMSITGHKTLSEVQRYIADANREIMADSAMEKLVIRPNGEQTVVNLTSMLASKRHNTLK